MILLIADDDRKIRFYLKSMLVEMQLQNCRFLEAKSGNEMVEKCSLYRPDVAFVDIDMPCLDGLSAIDVCRKTSPLTQYVVITGYPSFDYARKCVSLPVCEYVLKPIEFSKMKEIIEKLKERLSAALNSDNSRFQLKLYDSFSLWDAIGPEKSEGTEEELYCGFVFFLDCFNRSGLYPSLYKELFVRLKRIGEEAVKRRNVYGMLNSEDGSLRCVFRCAECDADGLVRKIGEVCRDLSGRRQIVSCLYDKADSLPGLYTRCEAITAEQYLRFCFSAGEANPLPQKIQPAAVSFLKDFSELLTAYWDADAVRCKNAAVQIARVCAQPGVQLPVQNAAVFLSTVTGRELPGTREELGRALLELSNHMPQGAVPQGADLIVRIKQYIAQNYMNEISVNELSDQFHLSPNYLSKVFHDRAGVRFIDYLTEVRMDNAKRLLRKNMHATVQDIALMVGYYSVRHFSRIFQKYVGKSPSDFRKAED